MKKVCVRCSCVNEEQYRFCKNCGASLPVVEHSFRGFNGENDIPEEQRQYSYDAIDYDGVSAEELSAYVGENSDKIMPKMFAMQAVSKKASWCFPVFIFGLVFGFFGMSFWFFARKIYKIGALLLALGFAFTVADAAINLGANKALIDGYWEIISADVNQDDNIEQIIDTMNEKANALFTEYMEGYNPVISGIASYAGGVFAPIFLSVFAFYLYKQKAIKDIKNIKERYEGDTLVLERIKASGGRNRALVFIPIAFMVLSLIVSLAFIIW